MDADEAGVAQGSTHDTGIPGPILDARAKAAFKRRLAEIDEELEAARVAGDVELEERADAERACILRELSGWAAGIDR